MLRKRCLDHSRTKAVGKAAAYEYNRDIFHSCLRIWLRKVNIQPIMRTTNWVLHFNLF